MSRIKVDRITNSSADGSVEFQNGITVTGLSTFSGNVTIGGSIFGDGSQLSGIDATALKDSDGTVRAQANTSGVVVTGVLTATSFSGIDESSLSDSDGTTRVQANTSGVVVTGVLTATSFVGDGTGLVFTPKIIAFDPAALSTGVAIDKTITITFDQDIVFSSSGVSTVSLRSGSAGGSVIEDFTITSGTPATGLSISGTQLIINPTSDLSNNADVYVVLPSAGIENSAGTVYGGSNNYNFRTIAQSFNVEGGDFVFTANTGTGPTGFHKYHIFTSSGIMTATGAVPTSSDDFAIVMVAGGGGGGKSESNPSSYSCGSGGGGAGGAIRHTAPTVILGPGNHTVTIGAGGQSGLPGSNTSVSGPNNTYTLLGGGGGGGDAVYPPTDPLYPTRDLGQVGGSGGGAWGRINDDFPAAPPLNYFATEGGGPGTAGQGNSGGQAFRQSSYSYDPQNALPGYGAGGGGAGGSGESSNNPPYSGIPNDPTTMPNPAGDCRQSLKSGDGGNGLNNPEFPEPVIAPYFPVDYANFVSALGPTGTIAGGGGGGNGGAHSSYSTLTPNPNRPLMPGAGRGGPGGGGAGAMVKAPPFPPADPTVSSLGPLAQPGVINTGGGGGGSAFAQPGNPGVATQGATGGSGVVMVRYSVPDPNP